MGPRWANMAPSWANMAPRCASMRPSWAKLGQIGTSWFDLTRFGYNLVRVSKSLKVPLSPSKQNANLNLDTYDRSYSVLCQSQFDVDSNCNAGRTAAQLDNIHMLTMSVDLFRMVRSISYKMGLCKTRFVSYCCHCCHDDRPHSCHHSCHLRHCCHDLSPVIFAIVVTMIVLIVVINSIDVIVACSLPCIFYISNFQQFYFFEVVTF